MECSTAPLEWTFARRHLHRVGNHIADREPHVGLAAEQTELLDGSTSLTQPVPPAAGGSPAESRRRGRPRAPPRRSGRSPRWGRSPTPRRRKATRSPTALAPSYAAAMDSRASASALRRRGRLRRGGSGSARRRWRRRCPRPRSRHPADPRLRWQREDTTEDMQQLPLRARGLSAALEQRASGAACCAAAEGASVSPPTGKPGREDARRQGRRNEA
jgi:hypothetical protein